MINSPSPNVGLSVPSANAMRLASISDNISKAATYGYNRIEMDISSMVPSGRSFDSEAGGFQAPTQYQVNWGGRLHSTDNATDLAVSGRGFLPVARVTDVEAGIGETQFYLTASGSFHADAAGYLSTESGFVLLGWPVESGAIVPVFQRDGSEGLEPVHFDVFEAYSSRTTHIALGINLPASSTEAPGTYPGDFESLHIEYFDEFGMSESIRFDFTPKVPIAGSSNEWTMTISDSALDAQVAEYVLEFTDSRTAGGTLAAVTTVTGGAYDAQAGNIVIDVEGGPIDIHVGKIGEYGGLSQVSDNFLPFSITKNGSPIGYITKVEVDATGYVHAFYSSGITRTIFQIPLADLPNPHGMTAIDSQIFLPSEESGSYVLWDAGDGPTGDIVAFAREKDATEIATELMEMIRILWASGLSYDVNFQFPFGFGSPEWVSYDASTQEIVIRLPDTISTQMPDIEIGISASRDDGREDGVTLRIGAGTTLGTNANDALAGTEQDDLMHGNAGNDILVGGSGEDVLRGGAGEDVLVGNEDSDELHGDAGDDKMFGRAGNDMLSGGDGSDVVVGGNGADLMSGDAGDDRLVGATGQDILFGGAGNDRMFGGSSTGNGDGQRDVFVFKSAANGGGGFDILRDFEDTIDKLDFSESGYTNFADVFADATQVGANVEISLDFGGGIVRINNFDLADLTAGDFLF